MSITSPAIDISATVGQIIIESIPSELPSEKIYAKNSLSVFGYGPIDSDVVLTGLGIFERTTSDAKGYFIFDPIYSYSFIYPEVCIQARDRQKRTTSITCIPGLSKNNRVPSTVGPVLLSPTVSISQNQKVIGDSSFLEGTTAPNTEVLVYIAGNYFLPVIQTKSDQNGNFSISLPTATAVNYKIFVANRFNGDLSDKSNTLTFVVMSKLKSFWTKIMEWVIKNKLAVIIALEVLTFVFLIFKLLKSTRKRQKSHRE